MKHDKYMCCIITPKGVIFSDKERLEEGERRKEAAKAEKHEKE